MAMNNEPFIGPTPYLSMVNDFVNVEVFGVPNILPYIAKEERNHDQNGQIFSGIFEDKIVVFRFNPDARDLKNPPPQNIKKTIILLPLDNANILASYLREFIEIASPLREALIFGVYTPNSTYMAYEKMGSPPKVIGEHFNMGQLLGLLTGKQVAVWPLPALP